MKLLVLEDDDFNIKLLNISLTMNGYQSLLAGTVAEAREIMANHPDIACFLLDEELPDGRGSDLIPEIRGNTQWASAPIIFASGHKDVDFISLGANAFVPKPYRMAEISKVLHDTRMGVYTHNHSRCRV